MELENILVSIIIPMYNSEKYIEETINSVLKQNHTHFELLIIDDCSSDESVQIVRGLSMKDNRIKLIISDINYGGPAKPRNIGLEHAQGEYIAFLDADDLWMPEKIEKQLTYMIGENYNFSSTNSMFIDDNSVPIDNKYTLLSFFKKWDSKQTVCDLIKNKFISTSSVLIEKRILIKFNEAQELISVEDLYQWIILLDDNTIRYRYIDDKLLRYRILDTSISNRSIKYQQSTKANLAILQFIVRYNKFEYVPCFYIYIVKLIFVDFIKKILGK